MREFVAGLGRRPAPPPALALKLLMPTRIQEIHRRQGAGRLQVKPRNCRSLPRNANNGCPGRSAVDVEPADEAHARNPVFAPGNPNAHWVDPLSAHSAVKALRSFHRIRPGETQNVVCRSPRRLKRKARFFLFFFFFQGQTLT